MAPDPVRPAPMRSQCATGPGAGLAERARQTLPSGRVWERMDTRRDAADYREAGGFTLEDVLLILRRRRIWGLVPTVVGALLGILLAIFLPPTYEASTDVQILPQSIAENVVETSIDDDTEVQFDQVRGQVLARTTLSEIIDEFALYADEALPREVLVERLRDNVSIEPIPSAVQDPRRPVKVSAFRISFQSSNRGVVAGVANRLRSAITAANLEYRRKAAQGSSEFIAREVEKRRRDLDALNEKILGFRARNQGQLPDELPDYRRKRDSLQRELEESRARITAFQQQIARLQEQLTDLRAGSIEDSSNPAVRKRQLELQITSLRAQGKTDKHPDIKITQAELAEIERILETQGEGPRSPEEAQLSRRLAEARSGLRVIEEIAAEKRAEVDDLERRIGAAGQLVLEYNELLRGYKVLESEIQSVSQKQVLADIGTSLEVQEKGTRFRVIEEAATPAAPVSPNRPLCAAVGTLLGLLAGIGLMALRQLADASIYTVRELRDVLNVPVLGTIPVMKSSLAPGTRTARSGPVNEGSRIRGGVGALWRRLRSPGGHGDVPERVEPEGGRRV